jgi:hypothetical protein
MASSVTRFFRKHNKKLIAIFGVGLMIVFLLPSTVNQLAKPDYTKRVLGEAYGKKIHAYDLLQVQIETHLLDSLSEILAQTNRQGVAQQALAEASDDLAERRARGRAHGLAVGQDQLDCRHASPLP